MRKSFEIKQDRAAKQDELKALQNKAKNENGETRAFTAEENAAWDAGMARVAELNAELKRAEEAEALELDLARRTANPVTTDKGDGEENEKRSIYQRFNLGKAIRSLKADSGVKLDGAEKEVHQIGEKETRDSGVTGQSNSLEGGGFALPLSFLRATQQTVSQDSGAYGGALVQNNAPRIVDPLRPTLFLESLGVTFISGITGGDLPLVVGTDFDMAFLAEGASLTVQKKQFAGPTLRPKRAGGAVSITNRLLMQSSPDAQAMITNGIRRGFVNLLQAVAINGAGGDAPTGLLGISGVNAAADTAAAALTWDKLMELWGLIETDDATDINRGWLIHPQVAAKAAMIKKDAGSGMFLLENGLLAGQKYISSSLVPTLDDEGTDVYPVLYGDWSQMFVGQWGSVVIKVNPYSEDLADSVRLTLNTHADVAVANPKAFAKNAFITGL